MAGLPAVLLALAAAAPAAAAEFVLGLGIDDPAGTGRPAAFAAEYRFAPAVTVGAAGGGFGIAAEVDGNADLWAGAGLVFTWPRGGGPRLEASVMLGAFGRGDGPDLGTAFPMFRSQIGLSLPVAADWRAGLALNHKSNASTASPNPGVETLLLTLHRRF